MFDPYITKYFYNGEPLTDWCRSNKISYKSIVQRMSRGCTLEEAIDKTRNYKSFKQKLVEAGGDILKYHQIYTKVYKKGMSLEDAVKRV